MKYKIKSYNSSALGFTLLEILLTLSVMVILAGVTIPIAWPFVTQNELDVSAVITTQTIRRAQSLAMSMQGDSAWGVKIEAQKITLYKGESYDLRNSDLDEEFNLAQTINVTGLSEVTFFKLSGLPNSYGQIQMNNNQQQVRYIFLTEQGVVSN